jgi:hypothetical protein
MCPFFKEDDNDYGICKEPRGSGTSPCTKDHLNHTDCIYFQDDENAIDVEKN